MGKGKYEFLIVGSGAGGATLARELAKRGKEVLIVEKGKREKKVGTLWDSRKYFDMSRFFALPAESKEGVVMWRAFMAGGSTVVSCANGVRCLEKELANFGIDLEEEFIEAEKEMEISSSIGLLSEGSEAIMEASEKLGYKMELMPKFIDSKHCRKCGGCVMGCSCDAKWSALRYLEEAQQRGADVLYRATVESVILNNGKAQGVRGRGAYGPFELLSDVVILAAGGLTTPVILHRAGIKNAGENLFIDLFVDTYGVTKGLNQCHEPAMALVDDEFYESNGFILSPFVNHPRMIRFVEMGLKAFAHPSNRLIGIMTKTTDDPAGRVFSDGSVSKPVTQGDWGRLKEGASISKEILVKAGADERSIVVTKPQGAHPGGTASIGKAVNSNLETEVENLFVCDASVLPRSPGKPPILTLVALAKRQAKILTS
ncbi:MAG: hypothetical protein AMJ42_03950 [Deltaproteobacteria bacterium DG_8]|nr:MAG: hypothetical protein AMJ42_03950 [Deltaproteobacteria bacterium DG_8]